MKFDNRMLADVPRTFETTLVDNLTPYPLAPIDAPGEPLLPAAIPGPQIGPIADPETGVPGDVIPLPAGVLPEAGKPFRAANGRVYVPIGPPV